MVKEKLKPIKESQVETPAERELMLFNDDFNTFEYVIETLMELCEHDYVQAEQCALVAHYNGKCGVKTGTFESLKPIHDEMTNRDLTVSII